MTRRRLLLTTDAVGGVWTYSLDLARALSRAEDMVILLALMGPAPSADQLTEAAAVPGLQLIDTGLPLDWTAASEQEVRNSGEALAQPAFEIDGRPEGAMSPDSQVLGTYLHGVFDTPGACSALLRWAGLGGDRSVDLGALREASLERLADATTPLLEALLPNK